MEKVAGRSLPAVHHFHDIAALAGLFVVDHADDAVFAGLSLAGRRQRRVVVEWELGPVAGGELPGGLAFKAAIDIHRLHAVLLRRIGMWPGIASAVSSGV
jgi:hypothetical protein